MLNNAQSFSKKTDFAYINMFSI